ncbi:CPBP family intramembrane metalloprotease [Candidatus Nomurabacteria bacterium]|nr:CPBP family intramembrane metalloprotease [Candidatus Nomurabacteria bacterium]
MFQFLIPSDIGNICSESQVIAVIVLLGITLIYQEKIFEKEGKIFGHYPWSIRSFFASVYEEIIFRGLVFFPLLTVLSPTWVIALTSIAFGLWHLKNHQYHSRRSLLGQVIYAGLLFAPLVGVITFFAGNIWPAIIIHTLNNLLVPIFNRFFLESK